jgi:uncharacterized protein YraI
MRRENVRRLLQLVLVMSIVALLALPAIGRPTPAGALSCNPCPATATADLNLRAEPSLSAEILLVIPAGAALEWDNFQEQVDGFVAVSYDGVAGWSHRDYLLLFPGFATTTAALNLRSEASLDAAVLMVLPAGASVMTLGGPTNGFFSVRYEERVSGWAAADFLDLGQSGGGEGFPTGSLVEVATDALNLRSAPGMAGSVLAVLPTGSQGTVLEPPQPLDSYLWHRVDFGAGYGAGWVAGEFLAYVSAGGGFAIGESVVVIDGPLNYRVDPAIGSGILEVLAEGTDGAVLDGPVYADGYAWYQLGLPGYGPDGATPGWVAGEFLGPA